MKLNSYWNIIYFGSNPKSPLLFVGIVYSSSQQKYYPWTNNTSNVLHIQNNNLLRYICLLSHILVTYLSMLSGNTCSSFQLPCAISDIVFKLNMKAVIIGRSRRMSLVRDCCVITECLSSEVDRDILPVRKKLNKTKTKIYILFCP